MPQTQTIAVNFTGGILSPGYLHSLLLIAESCHISEVRFGRRQQLLMEVPLKHINTFRKACAKTTIDFFEGRQAPPNIMSSYVATGIFAGDGWLREGIYKDVFDLFDYTPALKLNICDSSQSFTPFFTGHINWIASAAQNFWHLCIRFPGTQKIYHWPVLVYTNDLAIVSSTIEKVILLSREAWYGNQFANGQQLFQQVNTQLNYISKPAEQPLTLPDFSLPYYEGFNRQGNLYWLGIYRRDESFPVSFLKELCSICIDTRIGELYTTPWKGIIIKGIEPAHRKFWDYILGKYRINVRHAANELNWQVEDHTQEGLALKRHIIRFFDKEDVRTYGLCFAVQTKLSAGMFGSVIIRKCEVKNPHRLKGLERFDILYTRDFNPNTHNLVLYRDHVEKNHIGAYLVSLCKQFYDGDRLHISNRIPSAKTISSTPQAPAVKMVHQCSHCLSIYDATTGDTANHIPAGTLFIDLPADYCCSLCDGPKEDFTEVEERSLLLKTA